MCFRVVSLSYGHTWVKPPDPIRTPKLSTHGPTQYCGGGPRGNRRCCMFLVSKQIIHNAISTSWNIYMFECNNFKWLELFGVIRKNWNDTEKISMAPAQG